MLNDTRYLIESEYDTAFNVYDETLMFYFETLEDINNSNDHRNEVDQPIISTNSQTEQQIYHKARLNDVNFHFVYPGETFGFKTSSLVNYSNNSVDQQLCKYTHQRTNRESSNLSIGQNLPLESVNETTSTFITMCKHLKHLRNSRVCVAVINGVQCG